MVRRRRLWSRIILGYVFLFLMMFYIGMIVLTAVLGNESIISRKLVTEMNDVSPPVIELRGGDSMLLAIGDTVDDPGFLAYDDSSIPIVEVDSDIDITKAGEYCTRYTATDEAGNLTVAERKVKVISPNGRIYLTFDDGPSEYTNGLLDVLNKYGIKATFFVTGYGDDALIRREFDEGHTIGLHTMSHDYSFIYANLDNYWADLSAIQDRVKKITGKTSSVIRFPGGSSNLVSAVYDGGEKIMSTLVTQVSERGYKYFDWNIDSNDAGGANTTDEVYKNVISSLRDEGEFVVLQHDTKSYSVEAVERIIKYGLENGFVFSQLRSDSFDAHHGVNN